MLVRIIPSVLSKWSAPPAIPPPPLRPPIVALTNKRFPFEEWRTDESWQEGGIEGDGDSAAAPGEESRGEGCLMPLCKENPLEPPLHVKNHL